MKTQLAILGGILFGALGLLLGAPPFVAVSAGLALSAVLLAVKD